MIDKHFLQSVLNDEIPITIAMGIEVEQLSDGSLLLRAPLCKNINHKSTAFGGSLYSVAVLTGWGMIYAMLEALDLHAHIVIQESHIRYLKPVNQDIQASCVIANSEIFDKKINIFKRKGMSRITLDVEILNEGEPAVVFTGQYVIHS